MQVFQVLVNIAIFHSFKDARTVQGLDFTTHLLSESSTLVYLLLASRSVLIWSSLQNKNLGRLLVTALKNAVK